MVTVQMCGLSRRRGISLNKLIAISHFLSTWQPMLRTHRMLLPRSMRVRFSHLVDQKIIRDAGYYGQIANIDDNFAKLTKYLDDSGLAENTILVFTTDNGAPPHNNPNKLGYRGAKGSQEEGGHRVPFFIRWSGGGIDGGVDVDGLSSHVDLIPTLASLCGVEVGEEYMCDGRDISASIKTGEKIADDRSIFIHHRQRSREAF